MNRPAIALLVALGYAALTPAGAAAQVLPSSLEVSFRNHLLRDAVVSDSRFARTQRVAGVDQDALREYIHRGASAGYLTAGPARLYGIEQYEVSRMAVALQSAERVASAALFVSALGTTFGGWDDKSSMAFVGAAAAAGTVWGGVVHGDDPNWRVRYRWEPEE